MYKLQSRYINKYTHGFILSILSSWIKLIECRFWNTFLVLGNESFSFHVNIGFSNTPVTFVVIARIDSAPRIRGIRVPSFGLPWWKDAENREETRRRLLLPITTCHNCGVFLANNDWISHREDNELGGEWIVLVFNSNVRWLIYTRGRFQMREWWTVKESEKGRVRPT